MTGLVVHRLVAFVCRAAGFTLTHEREHLTMTNVCDQFDSIVGEARRCYAELTPTDKADPASIREEFADRVGARSPGLVFPIPAVRPAWTPKPPPPPPRPPTPPPEPIHASRASRRFIDVVCDGPPGPEAGRFVEVEDANGRSINAGEWIDRGDGYWALRIMRQGPRGLNVWEFGLAVVLGIVLGFVMLHPGCGAR